jgi:hypothetical protein
MIRYFLPAPEFEYHMDITQHFFKHNFILFLRIPTRNVWELWSVPNKRIFQSHSEYVLSALFQLPPVLLSSSYRWDEAFPFSRRGEHAFSQQRNNNRVFSWDALHCSIIITKKGCTVHGHHWLGRDVLMSWRYMSWRYLSITLLQ